MRSALVFEKPVIYGEEVVNQDGLWKKVIGDLFEDFLLFFAPELHEAVDFSKRMFRYFYRIFDKFDREIVAFSVMTGPSTSKESLGFTYSYFGTTLDYAYNVRKVMDYDDKELMQSNRLFSKVVLATKYMHETKNEVDQRYRFKMKLMRKVLKLEGHSRVSITAVFYFIDYLLRLPEELRHEFTDTIRPILGEEGLEMVQYESDDLSPTLADLVRIERKEALEEGLEQGLEQGLRNVALTMLKEELEVEYIAKLTKLSIAEIEKLKEAHT